MKISDYGNNSGSDSIETSDQILFTIHPKTKKIKKKVYTPKSKIEKKNPKPSLISSADFHKNHIYSKSKRTQFKFFKFEEEKIITNNFRDLIVDCHHDNDVETDEEIFVNAIEFNYINLYKGLKRHYRNSCKK
jgi:hypothetical protein